MENNEEFIQVNLEGKDKDVWNKLREKFISTIEKSLDIIIDYEKNSTIRDEAKIFATELTKYAKAKLSKAGIENEKLISEIELAYTQKSKELAETRKINAEASAIEFNNALNNLKLSLLSMKVMMIGGTSQKDILFIKQIDFFLESLSGSKKDLFE